MAVLLPPVVLLKSANAPVAVLRSPVELNSSAAVPLAVFSVPVVLNKRAAALVAVFEFAVLRSSAPAPTAVLKKEKKAPGRKASCPTQVPDGVEFEQRHEPVNTNSPGLRDLGRPPPDEPAVKGRAALTEFSDRLQLWFEIIVHHEHR